MTILLIRLEQDTDLDILGVINHNFISLSNFRLPTQLLIINLAIIFLGLIFLIIFNYFIIKNDKIIDYRITKSKNELKKITSYLENNSIINIPLYQTNYRCRVIDKDIDSKLYDEENCDQENLFLNTFELSDLELEQFTAQQYIFQNYNNENFSIKIFNDNWIKIADSNNPYLSNEVNQSEIVDILTENKNLYLLYEEIYIKFFNKIYLDISKRKYNEFLDKKTHEINIVSETIRKKNSIQKIYKNENKEIINIIASPIILNNKVYGVALLSFKLIEINKELALSSINLLNFFIVLVIIILILSFFFLRGLIIPLNQLTKITILERSKINNPKKLNYPIRSDEIGILSQQIQIMSKDLKTQMQQMEKFTTDVAHELKNPLTAIKSSSELLLKNTISEKNKIKLIQNFNKDVDRMNILISDISNFSRIMSEIETEKFQLIEINSFFKKFKRNYLGNSKNIKLRFNLDNNKSVVLVNEDKFLQVILNLIDNSISICSNNSTILIKTLKQNNEKISIKVYDQGRGVSLKDKIRIFERFYTDRVEAREEHSGLGLSICREILKSFNGSIELTKSDNLDFRGACFKINLPLRNE